MNNLTSNATDNSTLVVPGAVIYVPFAISIFGLIGNIGTFLTIVLTELKKNYVNHYIMVLLVSDSVLLFDIFITPFLRPDVINFWTCFAQEYVYNVTIFISCFSIMSLTMERFFAIVFPFKHLKHSGFNRWKVIVAWIIPIFIMNLNINFALKGTENDTFTILVSSSSEERVKCQYNYALPEAYHFFYWPRSFFTFLLPTLVVLIVNITIIVKLRGRSILKGNCTSTAARSNNVILFAIPVVYVILNIPYSVRSLMKFVMDTVSNDQLYRNHYWLYAGSFYIYCFNFSVNFIIYALSSRSFRHTFIRLWCLSNKVGVDSTATGTTGTMQLQSIRSN
uniref:G-protein coupled receptors family 1 profile domain-containing protein n=1 Tax=Globodera rostochiensis TaxID=31243 RepID=A0A914H469_GLORO